MPLLTIDQSPGGLEGRQHVRLSAEDVPNFQRLTYSTEITLDVTEQDRKKIRWYLEDFLEFDQEPAPSIAANVETYLARIGETLFRQIFESSPDAIRLWGAIEPHLGDTRIEIRAGIDEATSIPWELIREPRLDRPLALSARAFVRSQTGAPATLAPEETPDKVRILLVICRPRAERDVPFRSVAGKLVKKLTSEARDALDLDVLRPPSFQRLGEVLRDAKADGRPYHIVHFDGHGTYAEREELKEDATVFSDIKYEKPGQGRQGFLVFEDEESDSRSAYVDGFKLGKLLRDNGVPVLVLNACQSAFAEANVEPEDEAADEVREEIRAYGSLAQAVVDTGSAGVVAMRYVVYVETATRFVAELYGALARGQSLGAAVSTARKHLHDEPNRQIAHAPRPLQDWTVPVVWEQTPIRLWSGADGLDFKVEAEGSAEPGGLDPKLPPTPDLGFFGRDETLYALDRAFDREKIVLLHAYAGSGKTSTAAEFARWFSLTGGLDGPGDIEGPVLFSSFERHLPLARVLDKIGEIFGPMLEAAGMPWGAITDEGQRRDVALQVLSQMPVLWIWDNVEPVTGFPSGSPSAWAPEEQRELVDFLRAAKDTKAKFLLTSRRDENTWLGDLPRRVTVPRMPIRERRQLAGAIIERRGKRLKDFPDLTPLLRQTEGNPLTILVTIGAVLRAGIDSEEKLKTFVDRLRRGEADFEDETSEGRSKSLGASLAYGFEGFSAEEQKILALLHLFQGFVDVDTLRMMGNPDADWCLEPVRGLTREQGITLLDRAGEIGLLMSHGNGYYRIHPALPWYFRDLFDQNYPATSGEAGQAKHAFVGAMAELGDFYHDRYDAGQRQLLSVLAAEEDNLLAARHLARQHELWNMVIAAMQGLRTLYQNTGRNTAWRRLVEGVVPSFIELTNDGPLPGREEQWNIVTGYRMQIAWSDRLFLEAERLQQQAVDWQRKRAEPALASSVGLLDNQQRNRIRSLAVDIERLGSIKLDQEDAKCVRQFEDARDFYKMIADRQAEAVLVFNIGKAYLSLPSIRSLDGAADLFEEARELFDKNDHHGRAHCWGALGRVARERFLEARMAKQSTDQLLNHINAAASYYHQALDLFPETASSERGITHNQLGNIYQDASDIDHALRHYQQAIRYAEAEGDIISAGQRRVNVAITLAKTDRLPDARAYAEAAISNFATFGDRAAAEIQHAQELLDAINQAIADQENPS